MIMERIGSVAYKLQLPDLAKLHPVFHVSQLKPHVPDNSPVVSTLPEAMGSEEVVLVPESILERHLVKKGNVTIVQLLIKWTKLSVDMSAWEDYYVLRAKFPATSIWGLDDTQGCEADVTPVHRSG